MNELADMLNAIGDIMEEASGRIAGRPTVTVKGPGRQPVPASDRAKVPLMQDYFGVSNKVAA